jgi:hypothetical protein
MKCKICMGNHSIFSIQKGDALLPLLSSFALEYTIRKTQENQMGLKLNGTLQFLVYAGNVNLLDDIYAIKKNRNVN